MRNSLPVNTVASLVLVTAGAWLLLFLHPRPPRFDRSPHVAAGEVLASEVMKLLGPGAHVTVFARDPEPFRVPGSVAQLEGFLGALKKAGQTVTSIRWLKLDPLRQAALPSGDLLDVMRQATENDVIVSFVGPPVLDGPQLVRLGNRRPKILAVCAATVPAPADVKRLFDQKLLVAAVVSRNDAPLPAPASGEPSFERMFKLITSNNAQEWSENAKHN